jgi:hypothetical protein
VKKPSGGSTTVSGPYLTAAQKAARDRAEASNARTEAGKAREEAAKAGAEARRDQQRAAADRKRHEPAFAREEMREARKDLARERRDLARAGRDSARAGRDAARARTAGLARPGTGGGWVLGGNDRYLTCAAAAVANGLLLATGTRLSDEEVLGLHAAAGGGAGSGASVLGVLEATALVPGFPVCSPWPADRRSDGGGFGGFAAAATADVVPAPGDLTPSLILELALPGGLHAVLLADGFAVTWGRAVPVTQAFLERQTVATWAVTWEKRGEGSVWPRTTS